MPRQLVPGQQGRKGNYRRRLARPTVGVVPALLLFYCISQGAGNKITHLTPPRYVTVLPVSQDTLHVLQCRKYLAAGAFHDCTDLSSASNPFQHFQYISPHRAMRFPVGRRSWATAGKARFLCVFFCCTVSDGPGCPPFGGMHGGRRNGQGLRRRQPVAVFPSRPSETIRYIPYRERPFAGLWVSTNAPPQRVSLSSQGRVSP